MRQTRGLYFQVKSCFFYLRGGVSYENQASFLGWAVLSDEQMRKIWPFSLLNDEQMSNKVGVKHQPVGPFLRLG